MLNKLPNKRSIDVLVKMSIVIPINTLIKNMEMSSISATKFLYKKTLKMEAEINRFIKSNASKPSMILESLEYTFKYLKLPRT
jgi:hypothetical protein